MGRSVRAAETVRRHYAEPDVDVVVVGAGFAGLYMLYRLRALGLSARGFESAGGVGGTWYWNRYPGARCDIQSIDYSYSFDPELETEWQWQEKYATQPEILRYLEYVADKHDLCRDIQFETRVVSAEWDDAAALWRIRTDGGDEVACRFYVMATGCLSVPKTPDIDGIDRFAGAVYETSRWPHDGVDFTGKRVAVIGTGSSGIQSVPVIAEQASNLIVFQRTPNFSMPAHNGPIPDDKRRAIDGRYAEYRQEARWSRGGVPMEASLVGAVQVPDEERQRRFDAVWAKGELFAAVSAFNDLLINRASNELFCEYVRGKIRSIVRDPETAEALCPTSHPFGTKRPCLDTNYYQTYNLPHVRLVDLRKDPIVTVTETGIDTASTSFDLDAIVLATGFDAMTGAVVAVDIAGRDGMTLADKWAQGPQTYLGLTTVGFPNLFMITGPGSPSVLSNMTVSIEQHVDWIAKCLDHMRSNGLAVIEPTEVAEAGWVQHVNDCASITLYPLADSWYMGANVPGKPRVFLPYIGGVDTYRATCEKVVERGYLGFAFAGPAGTECNDGVINRLHLDAYLLLDTVAKFGFPSIETLSVDDARAFAVASAAQRPAGPAVGEVVDGVLPGAAGDLAYRLYRPRDTGPHPIIVYFHGGGWVLGGAQSDDPFCRELAVQSGATVVSVDYRHAPESRFPAAVEDGFAAVRWIADHAEDLGGEAGRLAVCGWSAGGNIAAVVCRLARDAGGPKILGQVLVNPVTDCDFNRGSYKDNGDGYLLTTALMRWFWDHYADPADREDPRASPLRARDLSRLPQALVVTSEFDPLRDEGAAYARALSAAGVPVRHLSCRGQIHSSLPSVGVILSANEAREQIGTELRRFLARDRSAARSRGRGPARGAARHDREPG